jgi:hypothetical protein
MLLDVKDADHLKVINAIGQDEEKIKKYATYLINGGCNKFDVNEIIEYINNTNI